MAAKNRSKIQLAERILGAGNQLPPKNGLSKKLKEELSSLSTELRPKRRNITFIMLMGQYLVSNVGLFIGTWIYASLGANIFVAIELPNERLRYAQKVQIAKSVDATCYYIADLLWSFAREQDSPAIKEDFEQKATDSLLELTEMVINATKLHKYDGTLLGWKYDWTFQNALLYSITIMSTIGYGHISPATLGGKIFTMLYALIGVALLIVSTAKFGNFLAKSIRLAFSRVFCRWFRYQRIREEHQEFTVRKARSILAQEQVGSEAYMPTDEIPIPLVISMFAIFAYILLGAFIFGDWEAWDTPSAAYFSFITLTTIGFGDMVPNSSFDVSTFKGQVKIGITVLYCTVGMALISMCFSLIQEGIGQKAAMVAASAGFGKSEAVLIDVITPQPRIQGYFDKAKKEEENLEIEK